MIAVSKTVPSVEGVGYHWQVTGGAVTSGQWTNQVTILALPSGSIGMSVVETNVIATCTATSQAIAVSVVPGANYYPVTPCRLFDTRNTPPATDSAAPFLSAQETRVFQVAGRCAIPATATALSINTTVVGASATGDLVPFRSDVTAPETSNIRIPVSRARANNGILALAPDLSIGVFNRSNGTVHFILDVNGYFE